MAGKHHKSSRPAAVLAAVVAPGGLAAAAVAATSLSTAVVTGTTTAAAPSVDLLALITPANSTSQIFAGTTYYGTDYTQEGYGTQQVVPFLAGPQGIANAISDAGGDPRGIVVLASGWGAGQTGTALGNLAENDANPANDDPALTDVDLVILDNNTNRAAGGFWTTYDIFAPLLVTSNAPTRSDLGVHILDVGYEYNINGDAPTDPTNLFSLGNSLAAYVYGYGGEQTADVPQAAIDEAKGPTTALHHHYIVDENGDYTTVDLPGSTTTYVTFDSEHLPLLRPLRLVPGGDIVADALEPTMTELVDAGYQDGESIPSDPRVPQPMTLFSSIGNLGGVPGSVQDGLAAGVGTAGQDLSNPGNFVTKPLDEFGKLPFVSTLPTSLPTSTLAKNNVNTTGAKPLLPGLNKPAGTTSSAGRPRPLKKIADSIKSSLNKLAGAAHETADPGTKAP